MDREVKLLFDKYLYGNPNPAEIKHLKELIGGRREVTEEYLAVLWEEYKAPAEANRAAYESISERFGALMKTARTVSLGRRLWRAAAAVLLPLAVGAGAYFYASHRQVALLAQQAYTVSAGTGVTTITLPDSTEVRMNAKACLSYPACFAGNKRVVRLTGEALFKVRHDAQRPFIVSTAGMDVEVLGTVFNLNAPLCCDWTEVSLIEGRVMAVPLEPAHRKAVLQPGQWARYNSQTGEMLVSKVDTHAVTAWTRGILVFRSAQLKDVLAKVAEFYGIELKVEGNYPETAFTGSFNEENIAPVLRNLQQHYHFKFNKTDKIININF